MADIKNNIFRIKNSVLIQVFVPINKNIQCSNVTIEFRSPTNAVYISHTSSGSIFEEKIHTKPKDLIECHLEYIKEEIQCFISYFLRSDLVGQESYAFYPESISQIPLEMSSVRKMSSLGKSFEEKMYYFKNVTNKHSNWKFFIQSKGHVLVKTIKSDNKRVTVCFGENNFDLLASDYIFDIYPGTSYFTIPKEILKMYNSLGSDIVISELIQSDFHKLNNVYYKIPISNSIRLEEFLPDKRSLYLFSTPTGSSFSNEWCVSDINLPIKI